jgi:5-formyltetrahydrofolate cyclo-ligase
MTKDEIRDQMRTRRSQVSDDELLEAGRDIAERLREMDCFQRSWRFCCYLGVGDEIPTRYIIRTCFESGREVCVPAWDSLNSRYGLFAFDEGMRLVKGRKGIREPEVKVPVQPWDVDVFVLPGLAFDLRGGRLGYGGGHFDRILAKAHSACNKVAVAFDWQVQETDLPLTEHDIRTDWILTSTRMIDCRAKHTAPRSDGQTVGRSDSQTV